MKKLFFSAFLILLVSLGEAIASTAYDRIIVTVNDYVVTQNEVEIALNTRLRNGGSINDEQKKDLKQSIINGLIEEALLDIKADELEIKITDEMVDNEINRIMTMNNLTRPQFEDLIERQQMTLLDFRENRKEQMRREMVVNQEIRSNIQIDEDQLKEQYENSGNKTMLVNARHILARTSGSASDAELNQAKDKILKIKGLIEDGMSFEDAATQYSEDPSVKNNQGNLGFFKKEDMVAEFSQAAFSLPPGQLSEPVRSPFGYHLIEVLEKKAEDSKPYESVKEELYQREYQKKFREEYSAYINELKNKATIVIR